MEIHPHNSNIREDNHNHPPREGGNREDHSQEAPHQLVNEDETMENWEEGTSQVGLSEDTTQTTLRVGGSRRVQFG